MPDMSNEEKIRCCWMCVSGSLEKMFCAAGVYAFICSIIGREITVIKLIGFSAGWSACRLAWQAWVINKRLKEEQNDT